MVGERTATPGRQRAWFWSTLVIAIAGLGPAAWIGFELWGNRGAPNTGGDMAILAWAFLVIAAVPGFVSFTALLLRNRFRRTSATLAMCVPVFALWMIPAVGGSLIEDPLLLGVVIPAVGYLVLCGSIALTP